MFRISLISLAFVLITSCTENSTHGSLYENIDLEEFKDTYDGVFFDCGAWFGLARNMEGAPGLAAPFFLSDSNGYYFKEELFKISLMNGDKDIPLNQQSYLLPGRMIQHLKTDDTEIFLQYFFIDHQSVICKYEIVNHIQDKADLNIIWHFASGAEVIGNRLSYSLSNGELLIEFKGSPPVDDQFEYSERFTKSSDTIKGSFAVRHRFGSELPLNNIDFWTIDDMLQTNQSRWQSYLAPFDHLNAKEKMLAAKCIQTLISNWRAPAGELKHAGLFPSWAYRGFHGFWSWDSWKHAVALSLFHPELGKEQIRAMFDFQDEYGMIADCIFRDTLIENHNWRDTKPPLAAWAVYNVHKQTNDTSFIEEMIHGLLKYHYWWYENRDHNKNGLCEYGSTDGSRVAAAWESGMDNAVRFDHAELIRNNDNAWSLNQESVDLNAYLYAEKIFLMKLCTISGRYKYVDRLNREAEVLRDKISNSFYNHDEGYFFDLKTDDRSHINVYGPEGWLPLWAGAADEKQAKMVLKVIMDTLHFNTYVPFPTLSASHPEFSPENGYWRGPVWLDQAWFALEGLYNYGYTEEYQFLKRKLLENAEGILGSSTPIRENYHPVTGKGLNANHFSWSAAHILLLLNQD